MSLLPRLGTMATARWAQLNPGLRQGLQRVVHDVVSALPVAPPSFVAAQVLNHVLLPRLPASARPALSGRSVVVEVSDLGLRVRLILGPNGFQIAPAALPCALRMAATLGTYRSLLRGEEDADRLFFERALVMEGDTELGLVLKNTLDAVGPLC